MKTNYVLIDYENVQPLALTALDQDHFKIIVFIGACQSKIAFEVASALQPMGARAEYVRISGSGTNALDFHIAFYIGQLATQDPNAYFHIISKDTGFDPLIQHLKSKKVLASRSCDVTDIPVIRAAKANSRDEKLAVIITNLQQRSTGKPRTLKTLSGTINALFQNQLADQELTALVQSLQSRGIVTVNNTDISYTLPV